MGNKDNEKPSTNIETEAPNSSEEIVLHNLDTYKISKNDKNNFNLDTEEKQKLGSAILIKCEECQKEFKQKCWFDKHIRSHVLSETHKCDLCGKTFKRHSILRAHLREIHTKRKRYSCTECRYETNNHTNYKTHFNIKHIGSSKNRIKCDSCDKSYFRKEDLIRHNIKMHNASRFKCNLCDKSYTSEQYLRIHRTTHNQDFKMEHQCFQCGKMFPNGGYLSSHMRKKHSGVTYRCNECGKVLASQTGLRDHMTQHSGIRLYSCSCGKQFATRKYLQIHSRTHTGEKPYSCKDCDRAFTQKSSLTIHTQRFHVGPKLYKCLVCFEECVSASLLEMHVKSHKIVE